MPLRKRHFVSLAADFLSANRRGLSSYGAKRYSNERSMSALSFLQGTQASATPEDTGAKPLKLGFIGAGGINFGTPAGPWNHAKYLEKFPNVRFTAICDLKVDLAQKRLWEKQDPSGAHAHKWQDCKVFGSHRDMLNSEDRPDAVIIGTPPHTRGALQMAGGPLELELGEAGVHMFMEKPVSVRPIDEVAELSARLDEYHRQNGLITGVGYMLRYAAGVDMARQLLAKVGGQPISMIGRMSIGYSELKTPFWWDTERSGGPIVEQATHFVDLMRSLCGEIIPESIAARAVGPKMALSDMPPFPYAEHEVPMERRPNRATVAVFNFESGAIGSLYHSAVLEGARFTAELDIFGDGFHIVVGNPYHQPFLKMRSTRREDYEAVGINDQAEYMYTAAFGSFLSAVRQKDPSLLRSTFADALKTYEATRHIARASQQTAQSAWNAPAPWVTRARPSWTNAAAQVIQEAKDQQPLQVEIEGPRVPSLGSVMTPSSMPLTLDAPTVPPPIFPGNQPAWQPQAVPHQAAQQRAASSLARADDKQDRDPADQN